MNNKRKHKRKESYLARSGSEVVTPVDTSQIKNIAIKNLIKKVLKVVCVFAIEIDGDKLILHEDNIFHDGYRYGEGEWSISELLKL
jgi:hypothetical protein